METIKHPMTTTTNHDLWPALRSSFSSVAILNSSVSDQRRGEFSFLYAAEPVSIDYMEMEVYGAELSPESMPMKCPHLPNSFPHYKKSFLTCVAASETWKRPQHRVDCTVEKSGVSSVPSMVLPIVLRQHKRWPASHRCTIEKPRSLQSTYTGAIMRCDFASDCRRYDESLLYEELWGQLFELSDREIKVFCT
ncbi:hypothetical protein B296_00016197 [Ensete ventricosum]|uniref:Uncharacterized protein n=1 Tax=Ensete ventricosum TaxID=4639 RepID=A0A427ACM2_ENSVE|nr:hypothetical protein B296_00016197 [Ensete ventricosum]